MGTHNGMLKDTPRANTWTKNDNRIKETMEKGHIRQPNRNRAQILDECETELSSQSENEVRESYGHTSLDMAGMNTKQIRPSKIIMRNDTVWPRPHWHKIKLVVATISKERLTRQKAGHHCHTGYIRMIHFDFDKPDWSAEAWSLFQHVRLDWKHKPCWRQYVQLNLGWERRKTYQNKRRLNEWEHFRRNDMQNNDAALDGQ